MSRITHVVTVAAASIAAAAGAVLVTRTTQLRPEPRYLLELPGEAITVEPTRETGARPLPVDGPAGSTSTADALAAARAEGQAEGRRALLRGIAGAVSLMSIGALITILVLFATGALDRPSLVSQTTGPAPDPVATVAPTPPPIVVPEAEGPVAPAMTATDERPDPAVITIPAIGVQASVISLGLTNGALDVPEDFDQTGWWTDGPEPGEVGPAVVVGHVDSFDGPAVFFNLDQLQFGDQITITRADGSRATFAVRSTIQVDKAEFPTSDVYGPTDTPQLRLITCDGDFTDGSYLGNLIVMADLVGESGPATNGILY